MFSTLLVSQWHFPKFNCWFIFFIPHIFMLLFPIFFTWYSIFLVVSTECLTWSSYAVRNHARPYQTLPLTRGLVVVMLLSIILMNWCIEVWWYLNPHCSVSYRFGPLIVFQCAIFQFTFLNVEGYNCRCSLLYWY